MILITGRIRTNTGNRAQIVALCIAHCARSRDEPGCIAHNVHSDCEDPDLLVFFEQWADAQAVQRHFALAQSRAFLKAVTGLSLETPSLDIYRAEDASIASFLG